MPKTQLDAGRQAAKLRVRLETDRMFGVDFAKRPPADVAIPPVPAAAEPAPLDAPDATPLMRLRVETLPCTACSLSESRLNLVFGEGSERAELMFVGEAPGADEDRQGRPFVGRAGQLLTRMIEAMGFGREEVYIANVLKCRPPANRDPSPLEVSACLPTLMKQIEIIDPKVVVPLGNHALRALVDLGPGEGITAVRGRVMEALGRVVVPTFHPAYLLRNERQKGKAWSDLKTVLRILGRKPPAPRGGSKSA
jgi:DNA polymerase